VKLDLGLGDLTFDPLDLPRQPVEVALVLIGEL
jgi:hypothetical protein